MRACLLPKPHEFASALKIAQAAVITGPGSVQLAFDRDASVGGLGGLGKQAALVVDQSIGSPGCGPHCASRSNNAARMVKLQQQCGNNVVFYVVVSALTNAARVSAEGGTGRPLCR
jgi:hypothetical protein